MMRVLQVMVLALGAASVGASGFEYDGDGYRVTGYEFDFVWGESKATVIVSMGKEHWCALPPLPAPAAFELVELLRASDPVYLAADRLTTRRPRVLREPTQQTLRTRRGPPPACAAALPF